MFKIKITSKEHGIVTKTDGLNTQQDVDSYISWMAESKHWGEPEKVVEISPAIPEVKDEEGNVIQAEIPAVTQTIPGEYTFVVEDITAEAQALEKQKKRIANENFGKEFKRWLSMLNEQSGITPAQVIALRADSRVKMANDLADGGDIPSLKYHIENTDWTGLFPEVVKTMALQKITDFLAGWPS